MPRYNGDPSFPTGPFQLGSSFSGAHPWSRMPSFNQVAGMAQRQPNPAKNPRIGLQPKADEAGVQQAAQQAQAKIASLIDLRAALKTVGNQPRAAIATKKPGTAKSKVRAAISSKQAAIEAPMSGLQRVVAPLVTMLKSAESVDNSGTGSITNRRAGRPSSPRTALNAVRGNSSTLDSTQRPLFTNVLTPRSKVAVAAPAVQPPPPPPGPVMPQQRGQMQMPSPPLGPAMPPQQMAPPPPAPMPPPVGQPMAPGQPPPGQPMPGTSPAVPPPQPIQHRRMQIAQVVRALLQHKNKREGGDEARETLDFQNFGAGVGQGNVGTKSANETSSAYLGKLAAAYLVRTSLPR